jgi:hypothetical protein
VPLARSLELASSLNERLVCEPLPRRAIYEANESRQGVVFDVSFVQPERKFVNVAVQMLRAGVMIDADQPALQDGKDAFDPVRRHVFANIFASAVIDGAVGISEKVDAGVCPAFVGVHGRSDFNMPLNGGLDCFFVGALDRHCNRAPAALPYTKNWRLANGAATGLELLPFVLVRLFAADKGFVDFDNSFKLFEFRSARLAQPVKDKPSGLLRDTDFLGELGGRNALARIMKASSPAAISELASRVGVASIKKLYELAMSTKDTLSAQTWRGAEMTKYETV